jgi:hypothetical protein
VSGRLPATRTYPECAAADDTSRHCRPDKLPSTTGDLHRGVLQHMPCSACGAAVTHWVSPQLSAVYTPAVYPHLHGAAAQLMVGWGRATACAATTGPPADVAAARSLSCSLSASALWCRARLMSADSMSSQSSADTCVYKAMKQIRGSALVTVAARCCWSEMFSLSVVVVAVVLVLASHTHGNGISMAASAAARSVGPCLQVCQDAPIPTGLPIPPLQHTPESAASCQPMPLYHRTACARSFCS